MTNAVHRIIQRIAVAMSLLLFSPAVNAQTSVVTYQLDNVWLLPDISHPWQDAQQMTGTFEWTYQAGDFENGTGVFTAVDIPWYWSGISELTITTDLTSIEFTFNGNLHDRGLDVTLFLLEPLSPTTTIAIDLVRSQFLVEIGIQYEGHVISGSIVPDAPPCQADLNNDGVLNFFDVSAFLAAFAAMGPAADFTGDGLFNFFDVSAFLTAFAGGCP